MKPANILRMVRRAPRIARNAVRDLRYGSFLGGTVKTRYEHLGAHDVGNVEYEDLPPLFAPAGVEPGDVIVDVGAGKGRSINWLLERFPQNRIVGIELDPEIAAKTAQRLRRFENVSIVCGDATTMLPPDGTVFYLFNPFDESVMRRFIDAFLALRPGQSPSGTVPKRRIVYHNAKYLQLFRDDPHFEVREIELPSGNFRSALVSLRA
jgi:SAM-dependent methyltransferase